MFSSKNMHWDSALILIFLGVAVPILGRRRIRQLLNSPETSKMDRLSIYASTIAFQWLATVIILWRARAHGISITQLGLAIPRPGLAITVSIVLAALVSVNQIYSLRRLVEPPSEIQGVLPQLALKLFPQDDVERLIFFALVLTVAMCEEFIYRGFVQRVFQDWSGGFVIAGVVGSAIFFALAHLYQGRRGLLTTNIVGVIFSGTRAWTGSLLPTFVAHFVADLSIGMLAPFRLQASRRAGNVVEDKS
jgi:membrane protease YdiL (CAAX protease family)